MDKLALCLQRKLKMDSAYFIDWEETHCVVVVVQ